MAQVQFITWSCHFLYACRQPEVFPTRSCGAKGLQIQTSMISSWSCIYLLMFSNNSMVAIKNMPKSKLLQKNFLPCLNEPSLPGYPLEVGTWDNQFFVSFFAPHPWASLLKTATCTKQDWIKETQFYTSTDCRMIAGRMKAVFSSHSTYKDFRLCNFLLRFLWGPFISLPSIFRSSQLSLYSQLLVRACKQEELKILSISVSLAILIRFCF